MRQPVGSGIRKRQPDAGLLLPEAAQKGREVRRPDRAHDAKAKIGGGESAMLFRLMLGRGLRRPVRGEGRIHEPMVLRQRGQRGEVFGRQAKLDCTKILRLPRG